MPGSAEPPRAAAEGFADFVAGAAAMRCAGPWEAAAGRWFLTRNAGGDSRGVPHAGRRAGCAEACVPRTAWPRAALLCL